MIRVLSLISIFCFYLTCSLYSQQSTTAPATSGPATVVVICAAGEEECRVRIDDLQEQETIFQQARFTGIGAGSHLITLNAKGFTGKTISLNVQPGEVKVIGPEILKPDLPSVPPQDVLAAIFNAVGKESDPKLIQSIQTEAKSTLVHKISDNESIAVQDRVTFVESYMPTKWIRWDVKVLPNMNLMLAETLGKSPSPTSIEGDPQVRRLAIPADLKRTFEFLPHVRLPELLLSLKDEKYQKKVDSNARLLSATSSDDSFEITYDEKFQPVRVRYNPKDGSSAEIICGDYASVGGWHLPFTLTVRFLDDPLFEQDIQYARYYLGADIRDADLTKIQYNFRYRNNVGIAMWRGPNTKCFSTIGPERGACRQN
jgi:hypothetical protein